jgi:hypothetical protein
VLSSEWNESELKGHQRVPCHFQNNHH